MKGLAWLLLALIRVYQRTLSPLLGDCCRFEPSCSRYASACVHHHGPLTGSWLPMKRLLRCNPFFAGGVDLPPLPEGADRGELEPDWERVARLTEVRLGDNAPSSAAVSSTRKS
jgi:putative membrane protein insertion efficiency factor